MPVILYLMWALFVGIPVTGMMMSNHRIRKMMKRMQKVGV